jgi:WD40 repeat protein
MLILGGHQNRVHALAFAPQGRMLASVDGRGQRVRLWDLDRGEVAAHIDSARRVRSLAFAPGDHFALVFADTLGNVHLWDLDADRERRFDAVTPCSGGRAVELSFSPDGSLLAAIGVHEAARDARVFWLPLGSVAVWPRDQFLQGAMPNPYFLNCRTALTCLALAPDNRTVAAGSLDRNVYLWDLESETPRAVLVHGSKVHHLAYDPEGRTLAAADVSGLVKVWDAESGKKRNTLKGQGKLVHGICYSPDGRTLATASGAGDSDGRVCFWDVETARPQRAFDWGIGAVHCVAFAPDGMRAAAGGERDIVVWDLDWN